MTDLVDELIMSMVNAARQAGIDAERARIIQIIEDNVSVQPGGPQWADRLIAKIEAGEKSDAA